MKTTAMAAVAVWVISGAAAAQDASPTVSPAQGPYFAVGVQAGGELELFCDEDDACSEGGYGAFGRLGFRGNRVLGAEAEAGFAAFEGGTFVHAAALGTLTAPIGPVDLRLRAGGGFFSADEETRFGLAIGPGLGFRPNDRSAIRLDFLLFEGEDSTEGADEDLGGLLQLAYERRF